MGDLLSVESSWTVFKRRLLLFQPRNLGQRVQSSSLAPKAQTQTDGRRPSKGFGPREKVLLEEKAGKRIRRVIFGILPYAKITSPYRDANSATNVFSDTEADGQPSKKSKKSGGKGSVVLLKESIHLCCVVCPKCEPQERNPYAPKFEDRTFQETLQQERCARRSMGLGEKKSTSSKKQGLGYILLPTEAWVMPAPSSKEARGARIRGRFRSITAHAEQKKDLSSATGEVQTHEEAQVFVHGLDLFVTVQILDDTPAVLANSVKSTVIHMCGPVVQSHI